MSKKNITLLIILLVLLGLAYVYQGPFRTWQKNADKPKNIFSKIDLDQVDKVVISKMVSSTTLEKINDRWKVGGTKDFYVKQELAENMLKTLKDAKAGQLELVSTNKDKMAEFKTDALSGTNVELYEKDKKVLSFIIGKFGTDFTSSYLGIPGDDLTYSINVMLASGFEQADWRDTTVFSSDKTKITKLRFQYPNREFTVEKKGDKWEGTIPFKFQVNQDKIGKVLDIMSGLTSVRIPPQTFKGTDLDKNLIIVEATGDSLNNTLMVGKDNGSGEFYAKKSASDNIYLITKAQKEDLDKKTDSLK